MEEIVPDVLDPPGTRATLRRLFKLTDGGDPEKIRRFSARDIYSPKELREIFNPRFLELPSYVVLRPVVTLMSLLMKEKEQTLSFADRIRAQSARRPRR